MNSAHTIPHRFLEQKPLMEACRTIHDPESLAIRSQHTTAMFNKDKPTRMIKTTKSSPEEEDSEDEGSEAEDTFQTMTEDNGAFQRQLEKDDAYMRPKSKAKWDCETIISTYSNLDNHPSEIGIPTNPKGKKKKKSQMSEDELERLTLEQ